jgi:hypothetical protein
MTDSKGRAEADKATPTRKSSHEFVDAAAVFVPHPTQSKTTAELYAFAAQHVDAIFASITSPDAPLASAA